MSRLYLIPVIGLCVLFGACSNPTASNSDSSMIDSLGSGTSSRPEAEQIDKTEDKTSKIQSALHKAQSATEKASKSINSALDQAHKSVESASKVVEDVMTVTTQLEQMSTDAGKTLTAVQSGDFKTAQQEFTQLQKNWAKIQAPVEKASPDAHQHINTYLANIDTLLKQPNPDQTELAKQLSSFSEKNITLLNIYSQENP